MWRPGSGWRAKRCMAGWLSTRPVVWRIWPIGRIVLGRVRTRSGRWSRSRSRGCSWQQVCLGAAAAGRPIDVWVTDEVLQFYDGVTLTAPKPGPAPGRSERAEHRPQEAEARSQRVSQINRRRSVTNQPKDFTGSHSRLLSIGRGRPRPPRAPPANDLPRDTCRFTAIPRRVRSERGGGAGFNGRKPVNRRFGETHARI